MGWAETFLLSNMEKQQSVHTYAMVNATRPIQVYDSHDIQPCGWEIHLGARSMYEICYECLIRTRSLWSGEHISELAVDSLQSDEPVTAGSAIHFLRVGCILQSNRTVLNMSQIVTNLNYPIDHHRIFSLTPHIDWSSLYGGVEMCRVLQLSPAMGSFCFGRSFIQGHACSLVIFSDPPSVHAHRLTTTMASGD